MMNLAKGLIDWQQQIGLEISAPLLDVLFNRRIGVVIQLRANSVKAASSSSLLADMSSLPNGLIRS